MGVNGSRENDHSVSENEDKYVKFKTKCDSSSNNFKVKKQNSYNQEKQSTVECSVVSLTTQNTNVSTRKVRFEWVEGGEEVYVTGSFVDWSSIIKMSYDISSGKFYYEAVNMILSRIFLLEDVNTSLLLMVNGNIQTNIQPLRMRKIMFVMFSLWRTIHMRKVMTN